MSEIDGASASGSFQERHAAWHREVERGRASAYGPLSATSMFWLTREPRTLPGLPGVWRADADGLVTVDFGAGSGAEPPVTSDGEPVAGRFTAGPLTGTEGITLGWGDKRIEVAARSTGIIVRTRDPQSPDRAGYAGTQTFAPDSAWVVEARFVPRERAEVVIASAAGADRLQRYPSPGVAEFEVGGVPVALTLFGTFDGGDLRAVFADATGEDLTYPAARFVDVEPVGGDRLRIDFTRAVNPPAAYSAAATCPFPPPENRLPVRIEAGELRPGIARP